MSGGGPPGFTFDQALAAVKLSNYAQVAAAALVAYDALLTLDDEIQLIWRRSWGFGTALYFLNRYGVPLQAALNIVAILDADLSLDACYSWNVWSTWIIPIVLMAIESLLVMRVSSMFSTRWVTIPLVILYLFAAATMLAITGVVMEGVEAGPSPAPAVTGCVLEGSAEFFWAMWIPSLVLELAMLCLTIARTARHLLKRDTMSVMHVIFRDGVIYFCVIFASMFSNLLVYLCAPSPYFSLLSQLMLSLSSMVAVRLFLNLRKAAYQYAYGPFDSDFANFANVANRPEEPADSLELRSVKGKAVVSDGFAGPPSYSVPDDSLFANVSAA